MFFLPVIFRTSFIKTMVHVGTPDRLVMFCFDVISAIVLIFFSHSGIRATSILGVLRYDAQNGRFFNKIAEMSPVKIFFLSS